VEDLDSASGAPAPGELRHVSDPEALLPGEDPATADIDDAVHWVRVYAELLSVKVALLSRADQVLAGVSDDAMREADIDQRLLRSEADRYAARHRYWTERVKDLATPGANRPLHDPPSGDIRG